MGYKKAYAAFLLAVAMFAFSFIHTPLNVCAASPSLRWEKSETNTYKEAYGDASTLVQGLTPGKYYVVTINVTSSVSSNSYINGLKVDDVTVSSSLGLSVSTGQSATITYYFQALGTTMTIYATVRLSGTSGSSLSYAQTVTGNLGLSYSGLKEVTVASGGYATVNDVQSIVNGSTDSINNKLAEQGNKIDTSLKEQTELQKEQNETSKGILSKITDFFGSFFDNLINAVVSLVIPSSDDLLSLLDEVNSWFGERLGFIWYPFSLAVDMVTALAGGSSDQMFHIPALSLYILGDDYTIWGDIDVDLDAFGIFTYVRFFTSVLLVSGIVKMAVNKWDEWIGGHDS